MKINTSGFKSMILLKQNVFLNTSQHIDLFLYQCNLEGGFSWTNAFNIFQHFSL